MLRGVRKRRKVVSAASVRLVGRLAAALYRARAEQMPLDASAASHVTSVVRSDLQRDRKQSPGYADAAKKPRDVYV